MPELGHAHACAHGQAERGHVRVEEVDELRRARERARVAGQLSAWQAAGPRGRVQPERAPALGAPCLAGRAALEHDVLPLRGSEVVAGREPRSTSADDDGLDHRRTVSGQITPVNPTDSYFKNPS